jgi:hypothetical protein
VTLWGYALNLVAVPLLALAESWEVAALLIFAERFGKAIRTPARQLSLHWLREVPTHGRHAPIAFHPRP